MPIIRVPQPETFRITVLAFRNRFTHEEKVALEVAAETSPDVRVYLADIAASTFVDLEDERLIAGVNSLVSMNLIDEERAQQILTDPIASIERPTK